jgi:hypothetical protein
MRSLKNKTVNNSHVNFARNCMIQLLTKTLSDGVTQITSQDLDKIDNILRKYKRN